MATLKNGELMGAVVALHDLGAERVPVKTALKIRRLLRELEPRARDVAEVRQQLLERHVKKDGKGEWVWERQNEDGTGTVKLADPEAFNKEVTALMDETVECEALTVEELGNIEVRGETLYGLGDLLIEEAT